MAFRIHDSVVRGEIDNRVKGIVRGKIYAFPRTMRRFSFERLRKNQSAVAARLKPYLQSKRRIAFNEQGIFRHYPELDR